MSWGQANIPFDRDSDFIPGEGELFLNKMLDVTHPENFYLNSEVKFLDALIENKHIFQVYADAQKKEAFLSEFSKKIVQNEKGSYQIRVLNDHFDVLVPLKFIPFAIDT